MRRVAAVMLIALCGSADEGRVRDSLRAYPKRGQTPSIQGV